MTLRNFGRNLRTNIITGILVLAPIGAVLGILVWLWNYVMALSELLPSAAHPRVFLELTNPWAIGFFDAITTLIVVALVLLLVCAVGVVSRNYFGKRLLKWIGRAVGRVPVLRTVYSTLEQLLDTFAQGHGKNFRRVVHVEYPRKGIYALALVTGEKSADPISGEKGQFLNVFVPTTPNPTSGFYLTVPAKDVKDAQMTVEEALKEIVSMGIVQKENA